MTYAHLVSGQWVEITGAWATDQASYPPGWVDAVSPMERGLAGAVLIVDGQLAPLPHQEKLGEEIADVGGVPTRRGLFGDLTVEARKALMTARIRDLRLSHELGGFTLPSGFRSTDDRAQRALLAGLALLDLKPSTSHLDIETGPSVYAHVTKAQFRAWAETIFQHVADTIAHALVLAVAVDDATTHAQLSAINVEGGWPA